MSRLSNTAQGPDINSKEAVKHITSGINRLIAGASLEFKSTALCWWLDEHALISDDVHYGQFLEHEAFGRFLIPFLFTCA